MTPATAQAMAELVVERCRVLATITDVPGETTRTFLSDAMRRANEQVGAWMRDAGMDVHTDAAGNLHGILHGTAPNAAPFLLVSHLDTVPNAGAFDGVLGVVMALALATHVGSTLPFPLQVIALSEEEGVRFGVPFLGSRALAGTLDAALLARQDRAGTTVRAAIEQYGLSCDRLPAAKLTHARGSLEFHIEQGPVLEAEHLPLGVVEHIAGQSHFNLCFRGESNHAGTTPMTLRRDALVAAATWVARVETIAREIDGVVATVGSLQLSPGARNVVPGQVRCTLDVRAANDHVRVDAATRLIAEAHAIADARNLAVETVETLQQHAVAMDAALTDLLADAIAAAGFAVRRMTSGAGHDSMILAPHLPATMLFLRTPGGLSHHPDEAVATADVEAALRVGAQFLDMLRSRGDTP